MTPLFEVFIDTSYFLARLVTRDQWRKRARRAVTRNLDAVTTSGVVQAKAWDLFAQFGSTGANAVDCVSFTVMRGLPIKRAFTFHEHFRSAGLELLQ